MELIAFSEYMNNSILATYGCHCYDFQIINYDSNYYNNSSSFKFKVLDSITKREFEFTICPNNYFNNYNDLFIDIEGFCVSIIIEDQHPNSHEWPLWLLNLKMYYNY